MKRYDMSLPETLPTLQHVQSSFDRSFGYESIGIIDDDRLRLELLRERLIPQLVFTASRLHLDLTRRHDNNFHALSGRRTIIGGKPGGDTYLRHGMDRHHDFTPQVLPAMDIAMDQICESPISDARKLRRIGIMAGAAIASSQTFSDGNTRIARAMHDYIVFGREKLSVDAIYNNDRNFTLPDAIEELILQQNVSRLIGSNTDTRPRPLPAIRVPEAVVTRLQLARETLDSMYDRLPMYRAGGVGKLTSIASSQTAGIDDGIELARTLLQESYGPAAYLVAFADQDVQPDFPMNAADISNVVQTDRRLITMRVMSIIDGAVSGGRFISIKDGNNNLGQRSIENHDWTPSILA